MMSVSGQSKNQYESKDLIKDLINSDLKVFKGVELTMHIICASAVKVSVESDVESLVSRYEKHFKIDRQLDEHRAEDEMEIAENGPLLVHADKILKKAMDKYWKETGTETGLKGESKSSATLFKQSKVVDRFKMEKSKLTYMDS